MDAGVVDVRSAAGVPGLADQCRMLFTARREYTFYKLNMIVFIFSLSLYTYIYIYISLEQLFHFILYYKH